MRLYGLVVAPNIPTSSMHGDTGSSRHLATSHDKIVISKSLRKEYEECVVNNLYINPTIPSDYSL